MSSARILRPALPKKISFSQLHDPGIPHAVDLAEQAAAESGAREGIEVRVVQHVEGFRPELQADLPRGELLDGIHSGGIEGKFHSPRECWYGRCHEDPTQNQADQTHCAACAELPAHTTTLLVLRLPALAYFVS